MKYCPTCNRVYTETERRFCSAEGTRLSLKDPFNLVGGILADRYRLDALVGIGGFGAVYSAHHLGIDRHVAVKILLPHFSVSNSKICDLFEREAKIAGRLSHENIADVKDAGRTPDGLAYMVMEWLDGHTLEDEISAGGRLSFERAAEILRQVSAALDHAHDARIIHRDLKPSNIMIVKRASGQDRVKVLDFGIAKVVSSTAGSAVSMPIGTPHYASPEQVKEGANIDMRSDIYSLGVMLYQMLTGELPFNASSLNELIRLQLMASPPPLRGLRPEAPLIIERLLKDMLEKEPVYRPERAGEVSKRFDLGVKVEQLLREGTSAFQSGDYRSAVSKLEEALRLSPDEPGVSEVIKAAQEAQGETERRAIIDRLLSEASQAFDSREYGAAILKWEETLRVSPDEPGVKLKIQSARAAQQKIKDEARQSKSAQDSSPVKDRRQVRKVVTRPLIIASIAVALIGLVIVTIWLAGLNKTGAIPATSQVPEQSRPGASTGSETPPAPAVVETVEVMTYYLEIQEETGETTRFFGSNTYKPNQKFKLHLTPRQHCYLYIIAPGTALHPTTYLTARPIAATGVRTNKVDAGADFEFPGGDNWMRVRESEVTRVTVIFSPEPLQTPDYLASAAGRTLTADEYSQLQSFASTVKPEILLGNSNVKVDVKAVESRKPLMFDILIKRR